MNVLVTGGAGYIGSIVAEELIKEGERVIVYDSLERGHRAAVPCEAAFVQGDIADRSRLDRVFKEHQVEAVMHFAAYILAGESMQDPGLYFRKNVANSAHLLETTAANGVRRFVFSSTAAVYGEAQRRPIVETDALSPVNPYGESKLMIEKMLLWFNQVHGLRYAALRYFNAAGASPTRGEAHHPEGHLIPLVLQVALGQREHVDIYGADYPTPDGTCIRDYIHILDLASAHLLALRALGEKERLVYNLGNGNGYSVREVIEVAREVSGHPLPALEKPRRPGDPAILVASAEKIKRELGWQPRYPDLKSIVESAWRWHRDHPHGYA